MTDHPTTTPPAWIAREDMPQMPRGWYWAQFPGSWVFYFPERDACRGIDNGSTAFYAPMSKTYWGPWQEPAQEVSANG